MDELLDVMDLFGIGEGLLGIAETLFGILALLLLVAAIAALFLVVDFQATGLAVAAVLAVASGGVGFVAGSKVTKLRSKF